MAKVDPKVKREAVLDVVAKKKTLRGAARELGISAPALHESVKAAKKATEAAAAADPAAPKPEGNPALEASLKAAGLETPVDPKAPIKPEDLAGRVEQSRTQREDYCVSKIGDINRFYIWAMSRKHYKIKGEDAKLAALKTLEPDFEFTIRAQTDEGLHEILKKLFGKGWGALAFAAGMHLWGRTETMQEIAEAQGWKPKRRKKDDDEEEDWTHRKPAFDFREAKEAQRQIEEGMQNAPSRNGEDDEPRGLNAPLPPKRR